MRHRRSTGRAGRPLHELVGDAFEVEIVPLLDVRRARTVARILEDRAQLPEEGMGEFTKAIWKIVQDAIDEVCAEPEAAKAAGTGLKRAV